MRKLFTALPSLFLLAGALAALMAFAFGQAWAPSAVSNFRVLSAAEPPPIGATLPVPVTSGTNNPGGFAHLGLAAWWFRPDTNIWAPEISTNGLDWTAAGNHWAGLGDRAQRTSGAPFFGWNFTETGTDWLGTNILSVRIKRIK